MISKRRQCAPSAAGAFKSVRVQIAACDNPDSPASIVSSLLKMEMVFPQKLATQIEEPLSGVATLLWRKGALKAAEELIR